MGAWIYRGSVFQSDDIGEAVAFVYLIENLTNGRKYVGKKLLTKAKTIQRNKKKRKVRVDSGWEDYWGSNAELQKDVERLGEDKFRREILYLCANKSEANYLELTEQIERKVLLRQDYYNSYVGTRISRQGVRRLQP